MATKHAIHPETGDPPGNDSLIGSRGAEKPICVDLDGTLVNTDVLLENFLSIILSPKGLPNLPRLMMSSLPRFKQQVGALADLAPELLPYNHELVAFLREQKRAGRKIVLATAADARSARAIAAHLDLFDQVVASDAVNNLKGPAKARELVRRFGRKGFDYIGNDRVDLPVWREADGIVLVNASEGVSREARALGNVVAEFPRPSRILATVLRAVRLHQWVKNLLVFVPLLAAKSFADMPDLLGALGMFASFCMTASAIYLLNDLSDLAADRRHPRKRDRPLASGTLPLRFGAVLAAVLISIGFALAALVGASLFIFAYAATSLAYSLRLKRYPLLDVFILSALYTLRIIAGGVASHHPVSVWLMAFSGFTFLSLALVKRTAEIPRIKAVEPGPAITRRGYLPGDRPILLMFGVASTFASSVVLALFVGSPAASQQYIAPEMLWGLVPLVLFWQLRLWLSTDRGYMDDDPIIYASRDWVSWLVAISFLVIMVLASSPLHLW